jgi:hypothetical protein
MSPHLSIEAPGKGHAKRLHDPEQTGCSIGEDPAVSILYLDVTEHCAKEPNHDKQELLDLCSVKSNQGCFDRSDREVSPPMRAQGSAARI